MRYLKQNTATRLTVGPFLDKTNGVTPKTALTVTNCRITLVADNAGVPTLALDAYATASGGDNDMVHIPGDSAGFYYLELTAAQTNYIGSAMLAITDEATHCPVFHELTILPANVYDSLYGLDYLKVDAVQLNGIDQTGRDIGNSVLLSNGTGAGQILLNSGKITCSTNEDKAGYSLTITPPTAVEIRNEMDANSAKLAKLDATISSRLAEANYIAPNNAGIANINAVTDKLNTTMEHDGTVYRFTANALELSPSGSGSSGGVILPVLNGSSYTATATQIRNVSIVRGDSPYIYFNLNGNYSGWDIYFGAKENLSDVDYAIDVRLATWEDASIGTGYIKLSTSDTGKAGEFYAELELRNGEEVLTGMKFNLTIMEDVIR